MEKGPFGPFFVAMQKNGFFAPNSKHCVQVTPANRGKDKKTRLPFLSCGAVTGQRPQLIKFKNSDPFTVDL